MSRRSASPPDDGGVVVVDKAAGMTSHDVVARMRRIAGTRRVGHAGTLDPMATGVLVLGIERATRLLGHLALHDKSYAATVRLGVSTVTDDAEGEVVATVDASTVSDESIVVAVAALTGEILQVPSSVSAIKVGGVRSYARVRGGEAVDLPARPVTVSQFTVTAVSRPPGAVDVDVDVTCSSGTYVRALARDLGAALGVGGHLTMLRRTRVGAFGLDRAWSLESLDGHLVVVPLGQAVADAFRRVDVDEEAARSVRHGGAVVVDQPGSGPVGVFDPAGRVLALMEPRGSELRPLVVFAPA
ncbi:MAG: tRNA pseudouridine(55) synthase TruB [Candidatus Nanopelagicales bacterium]